MYMLIHPSPTTGTIMFFAGILLIVIAVLLMVVTAAVGRGQEQRMRKRMKERY